MQGERDAMVVTVGWPIAVLVCPQRLDLPWVERLEVEFDEIFQRREKFVLVTDTSFMGSMPGPLERKALTEWASKPEQLRLQKLYNLGSSTVIRNALARGTLQALYWFWTPPAPQHAARDFDEAFTWCAGKAAEASILSRPAETLRRSILGELHKREIAPPGARGATETR